MPARKSDMRLVNVQIRRTRMVLAMAESVFPESATIVERMVMSRVTVGRRKKTRTNVPNG
jgi:hypothetical protein